MIYLETISLITFFGLLVLIFVFLSATRITIKAFKTLREELARDDDIFQNQISKLEFNYVKQQIELKKLENKVNTLSNDNDDNK